jgi:hypothetical protein
MSRSRRRLGWLCAGAVVGAYAWWVAGLEHFTTRALVAVLAAAALAVASARWPPRRCRASTDDAGASTPWLVVLGALVAWELVAFSLSPRSTHPTLSSLADAALGPRPLEAAAFVAWLAVGRRLARP